MSLDTREPQQQLGGENTLESRFYPLFDWLFDENSEFVRNIETKLEQARMDDQVEMFLSRALAIGLIGGLVLWLLGMFAGVLFLKTVGWSGVLNLPESIQPVVEAVREPLIVLVSGLIFGSIGFGIGFGGFLAIPYFRASGRKREINVLLADAVAFMYALSVGGLNQLEILRAMAKADDTYGEVSKEFQSIVLETEYFDTDYRTAVRNQALETPSEELAQFLTDMLSILDSGGNLTDFLEDQKDKQMRTAKQEQQKLLDTMELFGEMYMTLSLFPLLLIIILVIMSMMGSGSKKQLLYGTVYGLIPLIGMAFLVLTSTVTQDEIGDGYLRPSAGEDFSVDEGIGVFNPTLVEEYTGDKAMFDQIKRQEGTHEFKQILKAPHHFFKDHPLYVLVLTGPLSLLAVAAGVFSGAASISWSAMKSDPVSQTFIWVYLPMYINMVPLAIFYEWNVRSRRSILGNLSENLRKLASANDTGMTLLESLKMVSETSSGKLAREFEAMHSKVNYGTSLKDALREFNNKYHIPRLARTVKLISEAQEASSQIQDVLSTAAKSSENQDDIDRERKARTRMQMVIIIMTYLTLLAVMALLKLQFLDTMAGLSQASGGAAQQTDKFGGSLDPGLLSMLFFHAVTLQAFISSFIAGYIRSVEIIAGVKFAVILSTIALIVWTTVEQLSSAGSGSSAQNGEALLFLIGSMGWSVWDRPDWLPGGETETDSSIERRTGDSEFGDRGIDTAD